MSWSKLKPRKSNWRCHGMFSLVWIDQDIYVYMFFVSISDSVGPGMYNEVTQLSFFCLKKKIIQTGIGFQWLWCFHTFFFDFLLWFLLGWSNPLPSYFLDPGFAGEHSTQPPRWICRGVKLRYMNVLVLSGPRGWVVWFFINITITGFLGALTSMIDVVSST